MQASDGKVYGLVNKSTSDSTILFSYDVSTASFQTLNFINATFNGQALSGLVEGTPGKLYGITSRVFVHGMLYSFDISSNAISTVLFLDSITGTLPNANIGKLANGDLVFSTTDGGAYLVGALVRYNINTSTYNVMYSFDGGSTGSSPQCEILETTESTNGIPSNSAAAMVLYPNPATNTLHLNTAQEAVPYSITNLLGEELIKGVNAGNKGIDISGLSKGMYFINQVKFVKE